MNLIKSTSTYSFFVLISRILGYLRDVLIAIYLGSGPIADAFFVAFRIPNTFRRLFSEGTFNSAFVPSYMSELDKGKENAKKFANNVFNFLALSLLFLVLLIEIFMPAFVFLIAPGFSDSGEKLETTISLTRITFPFLIFVSLSSFFGAILNSFNKFAVASAAPIILNIFLILTLLFSNYLNDGAVSNALNFPTLTAEEAPLLKPYIDLSYLLGTFLGQVTSENINNIRLEMEGKAASLKDEPIMANLLTGILAVSYTHPPSPRDATLSRMPSSA